MKKYLVAAGCALVLSACSSIVEGTSQNVTVITDPTGASCTLSTPNGVVGVANPTPTSVALQKSKHDVTVTCTKDEHLTGIETLVSSTEAMTFGNIIFGGIIGVGIDAASGAMNKYPTTVTVVLPPETFESVEARDRFFDRQITRAESDAANALAEVNKQCSAQNVNCDGQVEAVEKQRQTMVDRIEAQRSQAIVE